MLNYVIINASAFFIDSFIHYFAEIENKGRKQTNSVYE